MINHVRKPILSVYYSVINHYQRLRRDPFDPCGCGCAGVCRFNADVIGTEWILHIHPPVRMCCTAPENASSMTVQRLSVLISAQGGRCLNQAITW